MAEAMRRDYNYLAKAFSPFADTHPLRGDLIVPATLASGETPSERNYTLLDWMEQSVGRVAFVLPQAAAVGLVTLDQRDRARANARRDNRQRAEHECQQA